MRRVRIGIVEYLNTAPLVEGLKDTAGLELVRAVPSRLIDLLLDGRIDIGLISLIDSARSPVPLSLFSAGMIGCDGPTLTVRLFSSIPIERITRIHADTDSHTSVCLAKILLDRVYGRNPQFLDYDARERAGDGLPDTDSGETWPEAMLLIGDKVVSDCPPAVRYPHQLDLGEAWRRLTGLPFVYAAWACRADRVSELLPWAALLDRTRRRNLMRADHVVTTHAPSHGWPIDLAGEYLGRRLRFDFNGRAVEGARHFLRLASDSGLAPQNEPEIIDLADFVPTPG